MSLARSSSVTVLLDDVGELPAMVEADDDETVTLVLTTPPVGALARAGDGRATLEYTTSTGIHRVSGDLTHDPRKPEILKVRRDGGGRTIQRRDHVRVEAVVPVEVAVVGDDARRAETTTRNLSARGLLIVEPFRLEVGEQVLLTLALDPASPPLEVSGTVVRQTAPSGRGIHIDGLSRPDEQRLLRFITERERIALRIRRER
jgi:hypothetical protein